MTEEPVGTHGDAGLGRGGVLGAGGYGVMEPLVDGQWKTVRKHGVGTYQAGEFIGGLYSGTCWNPKTYKFIVLWLHLTSFCRGFPKSITVWHCIKQRYAKTKKTRRKR